MDLSPKELSILMFLVRKRLKEEARRPVRIGAKGEDRQNLKVRELSELLEHLEEIQLEQ